MKVFIPQNAIKAAVHCMAKKDVRYYLNGCLFDFEHGTVNSLYLISTNGHMLSAFRLGLEYLEDEQTSNFKIIVPRDVMIGAAKVKTGCVLESMPDGRYMLGDIVFSPIEGRYPDYRRVIPTEISGEVSHVSPEYVLAGFNALADFGEKEIRLTQNGNSCAVVHAGTNFALVAIMPRNVGECTYQGLFSL